MENIINNVSSVPQPANIIVRNVVLQGGEVPTARLGHTMCKVTPTRFLIYWWCRNARVQSHRCNIRAALLNRITSQQDATQLGATQIGVFR